MRIRINEQEYLIETGRLRLFLLKTVEPMLTDPKKDWGGMRPALKLFLRPFQRKIESDLRKLDEQAFFPRERGMDLLLWLAACGTACYMAWIEKQPELAVTLEEVAADDGTVRLQRVSSVAMVPSAATAGQHTEPDSRPQN